MRSENSAKFPQHLHGLSVFLFFPPFLLSRSSRVNIEMLGSGGRFVAFLPFLSSLITSAESIHIRGRWRDWRGCAGRVKRVVEISRSSQGSPRPCPVPSHPDTVVSIFKTRLRQRRRQAPRPIILSSLLFCSAWGLRRAGPGTRLPRPPPPLALRPSGPSSRNNV